MSFTGQISPLLQMYKPSSFNGLSEENNLSSAYLIEPEKVGSVLAYAFGFHNDNILTALTGGLGNVMEINNREYQWALHGQNDRAIEVVDNFGDGGVTPGINGSTFRVRMLEKWFESTDNLVADDGTLVRVCEEPYQEGNTYVYKLQLTDGDAKSFLDVKNIQKGARFSKSFSTVEEFSNKGGGTNFVTPFQMKNQLSTLRKQYQVSRSAAANVLVLEMRDPENPNKTSKLWTTVAEWTAMSQFAREIDESLMYSLYNKNQQGIVSLKGTTGRPVYTGAGLRQQIAPSNIRYYSELTYGLLQDFLIDLSYAANKWGGDHKFVALTGKMGMLEFNRCITEQAKNLGFIVVNEGRFINGQGMELIFEGQFTTVKFPFNIELTVKEFPQYDNPIRHRTLHPKTKKPIESYRFTILNCGHKDGNSNLRKVVRKGSDLVMWSVNGSIDPKGVLSKSISTQRSSAIDGFESHFLTECGIMLQDPTSCGELILSLD